MLQPTLDLEEVGRDNFEAMFGALGGPEAREHKQDEPKSQRSGLLVCPETKKSDVVVSFRDCRRAAVATRGQRGRDPKKKWAGPDSSDAISCDADHMGLMVLGVIFAPPPKWSSGPLRADLADAGRHPPNAGTI